MNKCYSSRHVEHLSEADKAHIDDFFHSMYSKHWNTEELGKKGNNKKIRKTKIEEFNEITELAGRINAYHKDGYVLSNLIRINNIFHGMWTRSICKGIVDIGERKYKYRNFLSFLKFSIDTYHNKHNEYSEEVKDIIDEYLLYYMKKFNMNNKDYTWLQNRKNRVKLYDFLNEGGKYYEKGSNLVCFLSLFYKKYEIDESKYLKFNYEYPNRASNFVYNPLPLSHEFIISLIKEGYITDMHLTCTIKYLLPRDFVIPKKKRKKRVYQKDKEYKYIDISKLLAEDIIIIKSSYNKATPKIVRDKNSEKKQYIPSNKEEIVTKYYICKLNDKKFMIDMIKLISETYNMSKSDTKIHNTHMLKDYF